MATRAEWAKRVERWNKSGLTAREFGEREGFDGQQLSWWKWRLRTTQRGTRRAARKRHGSPTPAFLPVRVISTGVPEHEPSRAQVEIVLSNGRVVRVGAEFDAELLEAVLAVASGSGS